MAEIIEIDLRAKADNIQKELAQAKLKIEEIRSLAAYVKIGVIKKDEFDKAIRDSRERVLELKQQALDVRFDRKALAEARLLADEASKIGNEFEGATESAIDFKQIISTAVGFNLGSLVAQGLGLIKSAFVDSINNAREFQKTIAEINSILPRNAKLTDDVLESLRLLGKEYGSSATDQAKAYYQAVSAGAEDSAQATQILAAANAAAFATQSDLSSVARVLTSTLNAYAGTGLDAATATDILVKSVDDGAVEFSTLADQLARVTPTAAALKVPLDEVVGSIAFLTRVGFTTEQATTSLAAALSSIVKPTKEAQTAFNRLGGEFTGLRLNADTITKSGGLIEFIQKLNKEAKGSTDILTQIFGDERATKAILAITNNLGEYDQVLKNIANSSGAAERAGAELTQTLDFQGKLLSARAVEIATDFGTKLIPALTDGTKVLRAFLGGFSEGELKTEKLQVVEKTIARLNEELAKPRSGFFDPSDEFLTARLNEALAERARLTGEVANADVLAAQKSAQANKVIQGILSSFNNQASGVTTPLLPGAETSRVEAAKATNIALTEEERKFQGEIAAIRQQGAASQLALQFELDNQQRTLNDEKFLSQTEIELEQSRIRAQAAFDAEVSKNNAILAGQELALANQLAGEKKKNALRDAEKIAESKRVKESVNLERLRAQGITDAALAGANLAASIAKDGSKEQFIIQKGAAIASSIVATNLAAAQALAVPPAPNLGLASLAKTTGALNTAAIVATAIKGFASGGIIGNADGATSGPDNSIATVRTGEMILNAEQQKNLFEMIKNGSGSSGDIIIQVDGREIARAVRNQVQQGFAIA